MEDESGWFLGINGGRGSKWEGIEPTGTARFFILEAAIRPPVEMLEAFESAALPAFEQHTLQGHREAHIRLTHQMRKDALKALCARADACTAAYTIEAIEPHVLRVAVPSAVEGYHMGDQAFRDRVNWIMMEAEECDPELEWVGIMQPGAPMWEGPAVTEAKARLSSMMRDALRQGSWEVTDDPVASGWASVTEYVLGRLVSDLYNLHKPMTVKKNSVEFQGAHETSKFLDYLLRTVGGWTDGPFRPDGRMRMKNKISGAGMVSISYSFVPKKTPTKTVIKIDSITDVGGSD